MNTRLAAITAKLTHSLHEIVQEFPSNRRGAF